MQFCMQAGNKCACKLCMKSFLCADICNYDDCANCNMVFGKFRVVLIYTSGNYAHKSIANLFNY
jgi:hypothetical protein